ncbi:acyltransferase [Flavobacterium facile]|uniref:acyltransferase n=1 Tax=Flavobacterium facile TaxID=2893174 RepID=UPI002E79C6E3|nr:acyltransferase [Flavobacterium sp. T-12]
MISFLLSKVLARIKNAIKFPIWYVFNYLKLKIEMVSYEKFPIINGFILLVNRGEINLGKDIIITSNNYSNPVGNGNRTAIYCSASGKVTIEDFVSMSNVTIFSLEEVKIEKYVMIGGGVQILDSDFHPIHFENRVVNDVAKIISKPILLKQGCFIGANSIILKGVTIGVNSVIGAGSVVSKSIPDNEIWGGNPAQFIKKI